MIITLKKVGKNWEVNGKRPDKLAGVEKKYFEEFLISLKLGFKPEKNKEIIAEDYIGEKL